MHLMEFKEQLLHIFVKNA